MRKHLTAENQREGILTSAVPPVPHSKVRHQRDHVQATPAALFAARCIDDGKVATAAADASDVGKQLPLSLSRAESGRAASSLASGASPAPGSDVDGAAGAADAPSQQQDSAPDGAPTEGVEAAPAPAGGKEPLGKEEMSALRKVLLANEEAAQHLAQAHAEVDSEATTVEQRATKLAGVILEVHQQAQQLLKQRGLLSASGRLPQTKVADVVSVLVRVHGAQFKTLRAQQAALCVSRQKLGPGASDMAVSTSDTATLTAAIETRREQLGELERKLEVLAQYEDRVSR